MKFNTHLFFADYQNSSTLFTVDRIPLRLIARRAIRRHIRLIYRSRCGRSTNEATRLRDLHVHFVLARISWQRATGVLILRIIERELRKRIHVRRPAAVLVLLYSSAAYKYLRLIILEAMIERMAENASRPRRRTEKDIYTEIFADS